MTTKFMVPWIRFLLSVFESYLGSDIKSAVRSGFKPLIQIAKHVENMNGKTEYCSTSLNFKKYFKSCPHENECKQCIKSLNLGHMTIKPASIADSFIMIQNKEIGKVQVIHEQQNVVSLEVQCCSKFDFLKKPVTSSSLGISKISLNEETIHSTTENIFCKIFVLPYKNDLVAIPILHSCIN